MWNNQKQQKRCFPLCQTYKTTIILNWISKKLTNIQGQMVNPRHQTPQGQSIAKPETPLYNVLVGNVNMT